MLQRGDEETEVGNEETGIANTATGKNEFWG